MKLINLLFYSTLIIIVVLVLLDLRLNSLRGDFDKYCITQYNINDSCPCEKPKLITSLDNLTLRLPYIQNSSAS
jgi:hypothetical protein